MKNKYRSYVAVLMLSFTSVAVMASEAQKAILITGASTGIGRNMAETLAGEGFYIYAGARKQTDMDALNAIENIQAVRLDVTKQDEIDAVAALIRSEGRGLYGLINNAGVAVVGPLIEVSEDDMQFQIDVNVFGPYRVTRAMAPMLIESKGRITTISSISGVLAWSFGGPYTMSKHAVEAYGDVLAIEMERFGVEVSLIEPGNYNSSISKSLRKRIEQRGTAGESSLYAQDWDAMLAGSGDRDQYKEPDEVSAAALHFMTAEDPLLRYMVVPNEDEANRTIRHVINELVEYNQWQAYTYDRDTLVQMLDEALQAAEQ